METQNVLTANEQPNEISSLQELCIAPIAQQLNESFDSAKNKEQWLINFEIS